MSSRALSGLLLFGLLGPLVFLLVLWPLHVPATGLLPAAASSSGTGGKWCGVEKHWLVPGLAMAFNLTLMLGGGITLKFFPIFYHREYGLNEMSVCFIMAGYWLLTSFGSYTAAILSRCARRPTLVVLTQFVGACMLFLFAPKLVSPSSVSGHDRNVPLFQVFPRF